MTLEQQRAIAIAKAKAAAAASAAPAPAEISPFPDNAMTADIPVARPDPLAGMPWDKRLAHNLQAGAQAGLRGTADLAGAPVDLPVLGINVVNWGLNKLFGTDVPGINFSAGDTIADVFSDIGTATGAPPLAPEEMSEGELGLQNPIRFGTAAGTGGMGLAAKAGGVREAIKSGAKPSLTTSLVRPYLERPAAAVVRDAGAGAGAGVGADMADAYLPEAWAQNPLVKMIAALAGGVTGAAATGVGQAALRAPATVARKLTTDKNLPVNPETGRAYTKAESELAARAMQESAVDPKAAAAEITKNTAELKAGGVPDSALPTSGLLSNDTGVTTLEQGFRLKDGVRFKDRDAAVADEAAKKIGSLRDPNADQSAVATGVDAHERSLQMTRDAEALPLLKAAEASGAVVDTTSVSALIDSKLATAKRPPVRAALTEAKKLLNQPGTDVADTSVSGLYEARKAINDIIEGRGENATGRFAKSELIEVRAELDKAITAASPEFGAYLTKYKEGSEPLDAFKPGTPAHTLAQESDVRDVATKLLGGKYSADQQTDAIKQAIAGNPEAEKGWRAAFSDVLRDRVTNTKTGKSGEYEASFAKLAQQFKENEVVLAKVYGPEDMSTLRQAHKLLGYFKNAERRATSGSDTAEKMLMMSTGDQVFAGPIGKSVELVVRQIYGNLEGGGHMRRFRLMVALLPTGRHAAREIIGEAWFNPEVAAYLLGKPVRNISAIPANHGLRAAIAADIAANKEEKQ